MQIKNDIVMSIRQELINTINGLNLKFLSQIYNLTENLKMIDKDKTIVINKQNHPLSKYVGLIEDSEAIELKKIINSEFSKIEGDW